MPMYQKIITFAQFPQSPLMKQLEKYFEQQHELTEKNLALAQGVCSEKIMHELRVSIKRIKALLRFVVQLNPQKTEEIREALKPYKKIFKFAGIVRDAQIKELLVQRYTEAWNLPVPRSYQKHLQNTQKEAFKSFKQFAKTWSLDKKAGKLLKNLWQKDLTIDLHSSAEKVLRQSFVAVRQLINHAQTDEAYHEARKIIKSIYYILHLVFKPDTPLQYQDLKKLEETIGDWHDIALLIDDLEQFKRETPQSNPQTIDHLSEHLQTEKQTLQQKIPNLVHEELRCWKIFGKIKL